MERWGLAKPSSWRPKVLSPNLIDFGLENDLKKYFFERRWMTQGPPGGPQGSRDVKMADLGPPKGPSGTSKLMIWGPTERLRG